MLNGQPTHDTLFSYFTLIVWGTARQIRDRLLVNLISNLWTAGALEGDQTGEIPQSRGYPLTVVAMAAPTTGKRHLISQLLSLRLD